MIRSHHRADRARIARHYDELDPFYRALWGEHLHHGLWSTGTESPRQAALAMVDEVARRAGIGPGTAVCDVGSGYGAVARRLAGRGARVTALTVSPIQHHHAVAAARAPGPATPSGGRSGAGDPAPAPTFLLGDWMDNRLPAASFDAVIAVESLSHMPDPALALAEMARVLRPGGRLVACVWLAAEHPAAWEVRRLLRPICDEGRLPGLPQPSDYGRWLAAAGFEEAGLEDVSHRVARTWAVCARRLAGALLRPASWRYLLDRRNTERRFALSVLRLLVGYRTGAVRYGILTAAKPAG